MTDQYICANCLEPLGAPQAVRIIRDGKRVHRVHRSQERCRNNREERYLRLLKPLVDSMVADKRAGKTPPGYWWVSARLPLGAMGYLAEGTSLAKVTATDIEKLRWDTGAYTSGKPGHFYCEAVYDAREYPEWYEAHVRHYCDHPVQPATAPYTLGYGWLSPAGAFYPCSYAEHDGLARHLAAQHYGALERDTLGEHGWLAITDEGYVFGYAPDVHGWMERGRPMTEAQMTTIVDLAANGLDNPLLRDIERWRRKLMDAVQWANGASPYHKHDPARVASV